MRYRAIFFYASRLRDEGNRLIIGALKEAGLTDIAPSHGDILAHLLAGGPAIWACWPGASAGPGPP